jgi:hypothetical protein
MYGKHHSKETKEKMSIAKKGKMNGEKGPFYGKHHSEETKKKISQSHRGKCHSEETKKKMSESKKGEKHPMYRTHHTEEAKKKISEGVKGPNHPMYGKHLTEETRKKLSEINKGAKNPNYKGGVSIKQFEEAYGMKLEEWKELAQTIRIRDKFICQCCGKKNATSVHHIIPRRVKIDNSPENLITLCRSCHTKIEHLTDKYLAEGKDPMEIFMKEKVE